MNLFVWRYVPCVAVLALVGCSAASPAPTAQATPPPSTRPSGPPTDSPETDVPQPSNRGDRSVLDLLPMTVGGQELEVRSASGTEIPALFPTGDDAAFGAAMRRIGKDPQDLSVSLAEAPGITIVGLRLAATRFTPGSGTLIELLGSLLGEVEKPRVGYRTIEGKNMTSIVDPADPDNETYVHIVGDIVFAVKGSTELVAETFAYLPAPR